MTLLQQHAILRRAVLVTEQLLCATAIYGAAALAWMGLGSSGRHPRIVTVLAATAVVAAVLALSRRWMERVVNWLAYGERADGYELASMFLTRLATTLEIDEVLPRLAETVAQSVGSQRSEVRVWLADGNAWRQTWPLDAAQSESDVTVPVHHGGDTVGQMAVGLDETELSPVDRKLLDQLAGPAGLALSTVRLTQALRQEAANIERTASQIEASRQRLVVARRSEQDRIRRQLATRVRPHLDAASDRLTGEEVSSNTALTVASDHVAQALEELRSLARGIFPARLADTGLPEALRIWTEERGKPVTISTSRDEHSLRLPADLAAALYFCAVTVLDASHGNTAVGIDATDAEVSLEVRAGHFDQNAFEGLVDRAQAFDGELILVPPPDSLVRIRVPLATPLP
jgi:signal transduction histidine kinase